MSVTLLHATLAPTDDSLPFAESEQNLWLGADVLDRRGPGANLSPEHIVEDLDGVLFTLKVDTMEVSQEEQQHPCVVHLLAQLCQHDVRSVPVGAAGAVGSEQHPFHRDQMLRQVLLGLQWIIRKSDRLVNCEILKK